MHHLATIPAKPNIADVRALVREDGSALLDHVSDDQIDQAIKRDIERPAATLNLLAGSAIATLELPVVADKLRQAVSDGSVLDYEPADDKAMRALSKINTPPCNEPWLARAHEAAADQPFLARRLLTAAAEVVLDADQVQRSRPRACGQDGAVRPCRRKHLCVGRERHRGNAARRVDELLAARKMAWEENERLRIAAMHAAA